MGLFAKLFGRKPKNQKYEMGLHKTKENFDSLTKLLSESKNINADLYDALEDLFIQADIGVETVIYFIDQIKSAVTAQKITDPADLKEIIVDKMFEVYLKGQLVDTTLDFHDNELNVFLFVGVNGVGKTTTIGKLAKQYATKGKKVMLVAGDTFRAGAIDQLVEWGKRANVFVYTKPAGSDPSSVMYDALKLAQAEHYDLVLCDTAGRLHNKQNLMNELGKIKRVIDNVAPNSLKETLLVIDATTGQNGLNQAKVFDEVTNLTGVVLTKLDGTAKGGIVLAIRHMYGLTIKLVGLGEKIDDLVPFDVEEYIYSMFRGFF